MTLVAPQFYDLRLDDNALAALRLAAKWRLRKGLGKAQRVNLERALARLNEGTPMERESA